MKNEAERIITFLRKTFARTNKNAAVIAVSGGIDSALSLTLLVHALSPKQVFPTILPYRTQNIRDAQTICSWNGISQGQVTTQPIERIVSSMTAQLGAEQDALRLGNIMARVRMIAIYDLAKQKEALVCGTENKSEHYLGYFTRFGDASSDIEPISHLYKTQVRVLAAGLKIPQEILNKNPSAGLWEGQTDENELGFSYEDADKVLSQLIDEKKSPSQIKIEGMSPDVIARILGRVDQQAFKLQVPYSLNTL